MRRPGLRTRITAGFAAGALILSASMALLSYELTRRFLIAGRERTAVRAAIVDAGVVRAGLEADAPAVIDVLRSLDTGQNRRAVLYFNGRWYSRVDIDGSHGIPASLRGMVGGGRSGVQRTLAARRTVLVVGVPLPQGSQYYEVNSLDELVGTLRLMGLVLTLVAGTVAVGGAGLGWYASRRVLRPLSLVTAAAQDIAAGDLTARLDPATEPELQRLTTSFNHMVDELSTRVERDRRFAADVSHELRSPLQTLAAAASVLNRRADGLDRRTATAAALVADEVERFQSLVQDLLELARTDRPELTDVDVAALTRAVCRSRGMDPDIVVADRGGLWRVDQRRVQQILDNLLDNALRHGGGAVAVRVGTGDGRHYLEVDDDGPGVRADDRERIFDRFVRGRATNARADSTGTGLGLALVARHATAHGGRALVTDRPGGGARFRVEFPARADTR